MIEWQSCLSVLVDRFDTQHKKIIELFNTLYESAKDNSDEAVINKVVSELIEYTKYHFSAEEELMEKYEYRDIDAHKAEHHKFIESIKEYSDRIANKEPVKIVELMRFLREWLTTHIMGTDRKYGPFFKSRGVN